MLLEIYITMLVLNCVCFGIAFFRKNVWFWAITLVLSAFLIFASYNITENIAVVQNQTQPTAGMLQYQYTILTNSNQDMSMSWFVIGMFLVSLVLFLWDLFSGLKEGSLGERKY